jgi:hypothetical protein
VPAPPPRFGRPYGAPATYDAGPAFDPSRSPFEPPPYATPPQGVEYERFVSGMTAVVRRHVGGRPVEAWRAHLDVAIATWRARGFRTAVLERARALPARPDVDGLLATYAAAAAHLRRLETRAAALHPRARGHAVFHDPEHVAEAEAYVARLGGESEE